MGSFTDYPGTYSYFTSLRNNPIPAIKTGKKEILNIVEDNLKSTYQENTYSLEKLNKYQKFYHSSIKLFYLTFHFLVQMNIKT